MLVFGKARRRVSPALRQESTPSEKRVARELVEARRKVERWIERNQTALMEAIAHRPWATVADMIPDDPWYEFQEFLQEELTAEAIDAGHRAVNGPVGKAVTPLLGYRFDATRPEASQWAAREAGSMVTEITRDQRNLIRDLVSRGQVEGITVDQTARTIRQSVGLTTQQAGWVDNFYERSLAEGVGSGLSSSQAAARANAATARYHDQIHRYRSETIARTEIARAASEGRQLAWNQGIEEGFISANSQKEWIAEADACEICSERNGTKQPVGKPWPGGEPPAHPNCRCDLLLIPVGIDVPESQRTFGGAVLSLLDALPLDVVAQQGGDIAVDMTLRRMWRTLQENINERYEAILRQRDYWAGQGRPERAAIYEARTYQQRTKLRPFTRTERDSFPLLVDGEERTVRTFARYSGTDDVRDIFSKAGVSTPDIYELDPSEARLFHSLIATAKEQNKYGASVQLYDVDDYANMRLFITDNGGAGFALKDGDEIVSVFRGDSSLNGIADWMVHLSIDQGGRRADAFDTVLPHIYGDHGLVVVARTPWNDAFAPDDWDKVLFSKFNNGEPDVVFMVYNPFQFTGYAPGSGITFGIDDYDVAYDYAKTVLGWFGQRRAVIDIDDLPPGPVPRPVKPPAAAADPDYRGSHSPPGPDYGASMDDVRGMYPDDFYDGNALRYYGTGDDVADAESYAAILSARNDPDAMITVYRAVPKGVTDINRGDWVTPSLSYARAHGDGPLRGDYDIIEIRVPASQLWTNADSINEWGYSGGSMTATPVVRNPFDDVMAAASDILRDAQDNPLNDGDPILKQIYRVLGYDALPDVIDSDDFDALIAGGATPLYRGIMGGGLDIPALIDEFRYGNYYAGVGIHGNGTYTTAIDHRIGLLYSNGNPQNIWRMTLSTNANTIDSDDLHKQWIAFTRSDAFDDLPSDVQEIFEDEGRFAAAMGYDAIRVPGPGAAASIDFYIILNRGMVTVDKNNGFGPKRIDSRSLTNEHNDFMDSAFYDSLTEDEKEPFRDRYYYAAWRGYDYVLENEGDPPVKDIRWIRDRYMGGGDDD